MRHKQLSINELTVEKIVNLSGTQASAIADAKVDYTTGDLDAEAEIIAAINATNTTLNAVIAAINSIGVTA